MTVQKTRLESQAKSKTTSAIKPIKVIERHETLINREISKTTSG